MSQPPPGTSAIPRVLIRPVDRRAFFPRRHANLAFSGVNCRPGKPDAALLGWNGINVARAAGLAPANHSGTGEPKISSWAANTPRRAFTLVEMLVVMTIIVILLALVTPVFKSNSLNPAITGIATMMEQARAYAMGNNTYVYLGFTEVDASQNNATPGVGRIVAAAVAVKDGTRGYDIFNPESTWQSNYANGGGLTAISKLQKWDNVHLATLGVPPTTGNMARASASTNYLLGSPSCKSVITFTWPLGYPLGNGSQTNNGMQYTFIKVIQFDPQGVARIQYMSNLDTIVTYMEAGLLPSRGNVAPAPPTAANQNTGNFAAIQLDAMSGAVRIFRP